MVSQFSGSIIKDVTPSNQPENSWREAMNMVFNKLYSTAVNESGFDIKHVYNKKVVGSIALYDSTFVVMLESNEIGLYNAKTEEYVTIFIDSRLNFNRRYPIKGVYEYTPTGDIIIAWVDSINTPKVLNIDTLPFKLNPNKTLVNPNDYVLINIFSDLKEPNVDSVRERSRGGSLRSGAHFIIFAYELPDGTITQWTDPSNPIYITSTKTGNKSTDFDGDPADTQTSKSVEFIVSNIDQRYSKLVIGVVSRIGGNISVKRVSSYSITSSIMSFEYTGTEITEDIPLTDAIVEKISYNNAENITLSGGSLFLGGLKTRSRAIDYQKFANNIRITPISKLVSLTDVVNSHRFVNTNYNNATFMPNEVYAFYAVLNFTDGTKSQGYHIPGRQSDTLRYYKSKKHFAVDERLDLTTIDDNYANGEFTYDKLTGARYIYQTRSSGKKDVMGYWENRNEKYPNTDDFDIYDANGKIGSIRNQNVRHHKFPEIHSYFNDTFGLVASDSPNRPNSTLMPVYGIQVENIYIPDELKDDVESVEIYYAKRDINNRTVLETGFINGSGLNSLPAGSVNTNEQRALSAVNFITDDLDTRPLRLYGFGMINSKPNVLPTHVRLIGSILNYTSTTTNGITTVLVSNVSSYSSYFDQLDGIGYNYFLNFEDQSKDIIKVGNVEYAAPNSQSNSYGNTNREEALLARLDIPNANLVNINSLLPSIYGVKTNKGNVAPCSFEVLRSDIYNSFTEQFLVSTSAKVYVNSIDNIYSLSTYSGDTFVSMYAHTVWIAPETSTDVGIRTRIINCPVYSDANVGLRYEGEGENETYPLKGSITEGRSRNNFYGYNSDYSFRNELIIVKPYDTNGNEEIVNFSNRIIRTPISNVESQLINWRNFPPDLYYEIERTRGKLTNLAGIGDSLFIHCEYGLYKTVSTDRLEAALTEITISTKDIFSIKPKETLPDDTGYLGNQHSFCSFITKGSYFFVDADAGKVFMIREGVNEISNYGLRNWFLKNLPFNCVKQFKENNIDFTINTNAPTEYAGFTAGFDPINNTIYLTKKDFVVNNIGRLKVEGDQLLYKNDDSVFVPFDPNIHGTDKSWTRSFSLEASKNGGWVSLHSYKPSMYLFNRKNIFSINNNKLYEHNSSDSYCKFYDGIIYPSYIDTVMNERRDMSKVYFSVNWKMDFISKEIFDSIIVYNDKYCTGQINLTPANSSISRDTYNFNDLKNRATTLNSSFINEDTSELVEEFIDDNITWFNKGKIKGNYAIIRLITSNSNQNSLYLNSINAEYRIAYV